MKILMCRSMFAAFSLIIGVQAFAAQGILNINASSAGPKDFATAASITYNTIQSGQRMPAQANFSTDLTVNFDMFDPITVSYQGTSVTFSVYEGIRFALYAVPYSGGDDSASSACQQARPSLSGTLSNATVLVQPTQNPSTNGVVICFMK